LHSTPTNNTTLKKVIIPRAEHSISRQDISDNALKVLYRLNNAGYQAYLVGGGVRDLLLGKKPKDFDIATDATPEQIKKLFRNCRLVGRRFRLAHILFGRDIIEVATFRGHHQAEESDKQTSQQSEQGMLLRDNVYGNLEEDAQRRDFTVNALYYNIDDYSVVDFAGGLADLKAKQLTLIGEPATRYREDPVRMLRAARFAAKLDFEITPETAAPIQGLAPLLRDIPAPRLFEECLKLFLAGEGEQTLLTLHNLGLLFPMFPALRSLLSDADEHNPTLAFMLQALANTDARVHSEQRVTPAFIFAALLWPVVEMTAQELLIELSLPMHDAIELAMNQVLDQQCRSVAIPRRFTTAIREIWQLQDRLARRQGKKAFRTFEHPRFRAAFDFLLIRGETSGDSALIELGQWWQQWQKMNERDRSQMVRELGQSKPKRHRRPSRSSNKPSNREG
jgi:poly(A) polymerase